MDAHVLVPGPVERWRAPRHPLDPALVLRLAGQRRPAEAAPPIWDAARRMAARADQLAAPTALLKGVRVERADAGGVRIAGGPRFSSRALATLLAACPGAVAFALTLGPAIEEEAAALAERHEPLDAFLLDTAGWAAIEAAVRALRLWLRARARPLGRRVTHRLAPGYADWPLEEQARLVQLLDGVPPLVRVSEHGVLAPFKSITGLFGVAPGL